MLLWPKDILAVHTVARRRAGLGRPGRGLVNALEQGGKKLFDRAVPIFIYQVAIAKDRYNVVGVRPQDLPILLGKNGFEAGRVFDPDNKFSQWINQRLSQQGSEVVELSDELQGQIIGRTSHYA